MAPKQEELVRHPSAALIIPALNEAPVIATTLARVPPGLFERVIVADNGSTDGTAEAAASAGATVVSIPERGYGAACLAALRTIEHVDAVVFLQADGSEDPAEAALLLAPIYDGRADFVLGSRVRGKVKRGALLPHQRFGNWLVTALIRLIWGHRYTDLGPFRAIRLSALHRLGMADRNYGWTVEMQVRALTAGLRLMEVPVSYGKRGAGEEKVSGSLSGSIRAGARMLLVVARLAIARQ